MIPVSTDYIENIIAQIRQFRSRATITMDAFSQLTPITNSITTNLLNKIQGSTVENPNIAQYAKASSLQIPTGSWTILTQGYYNAIMTADDNPFDVHAATASQYAQMLFKFDLVTLFERQFGTSFWQGGTTLAEKITVLKQYLNDMTFHWKGYGMGVSTPGTAYQPPVTTYDNVRYIRDYANGSNVNAFNYWNEVQALTAGAVNRAQGKTPTISSGTLTNPANLTDGTKTTYGYESSGNGIQKYVQIDLGAIYNDITQIKIIHYYLDTRTFHGTKTQYSSDGTNWTTVYDSSVSGEYLEPADGSGKTYAVHSTTTPEVPATNDVISYQCGITYWNATTQAWQWSAVHAPSNQVNTDNSFPVSDIANIIGSDGFAYFTVYTQYQSTATTPADLFTDYIELDMNIVFSATRQYLDDVIMKMNIVEEISVLNDAVPSNELQITLNNKSGDFDVITFNNITEVLANRPNILCELGLVYDKPSGINYLLNPTLDNFINSTTIADNWSAWNG